MSGKAGKVGGFDLSALESWAEEANEAPPEAPEGPKMAPQAKKATVPAPTVTRAPKTPEKRPQVAKTGRKKGDDRKFNLNVRLTEAEASKLKDHAGLVSLSVYVRKVLHDQDVI